MDIRTAVDRHDKALKRTVSKHLLSTLCGHSVLVHVGPVSPKAVLSAVLCLAGCGGPRGINMADGKCESIAVGDYVKGTAVLHSYAGLGCMECGAYLTRDGCDGLTWLSTANSAVDAQYEVVTRRREADAPQEPVERRIFVSGKVIPRGDNGKPMVNADRLVLVR